MKTYSKVYLIAFFSLALPLAAGAATVNFTINTTLVLPSTGDNYTIDSGSSVESLDVSSGTITVSLIGGEHLTLESADKRKFSNSLNTTWDCNTNTSSITFSRDITASSTQTFTITPSGSCGSGSSGGGGIIGGGGSSGGGGGGSYAPTVISPTPTPAMPSTTPAATVANPSERAQTVSPVFNKDIVIGHKGNDVSQLQALLASDKSIYPEGLVTGYFGKLTSAAVKRFQKKYGLPQVGRVGPLTRKKLNEVFGAAGTAPAQQPVSQASQIQALLDQIKILQAQLDALKKSKH